MCAAIRIVDGIGVAQHLVVVAVVVLQNDMDMDLDLLLARGGLALLKNGDGLRMQGRPALVQLPNELFQTFFVQEGFQLRVGQAFIQEGDLQPRVDAGQLPKTLSDPV